MCANKQAAVRGFKARTLVAGLLTLPCLLAAAPATAQVNYAISGNTAYVAKSSGAFGDIVIASTYNGYPVTSIAIDAFASCYLLANLTIPNSVTSIGYLAFYNCISLTNVTMGNGVTNIGPYAFVNCSSLVSVNIPDGLTSFQDSVFSDCRSLTSVRIPGSVTSIGTGAFRNCRGLTGVAIPDSVASIGLQAFSDCAGLTSVTIPNSVTNIGDLAFDGCVSLTNLSVDAANPAYSSVDGVLFNKAQTTLITHPAARTGSYVIPGSVISMGDRAFAYGRLTSVTMPDSVTSIGTALYSGTGGGVFMGCTSLTNVIIGNSVTNIGYVAFVGCTNLTRLTIPASVINIGSTAFADCSNLTNCTFLGNAPQLVFDMEAGGAWFSRVGAGARAYYYCGTTGWGPTYGGLPTVMLVAPRIARGSAGVKPGGFGFTVVPCLANQTIVVEASANLVNWQPIWTNTLSGASADFVDPDWLQHPIRFYRAR
jgi:hypothetical protein